MAVRLKNNFKEHQITTDLCERYDPDLLKNNFKEHQITTEGYAIYNVND